MTTYQNVTIAQHNLIKGLVLCSLYHFPFRSSGAQLRIKKTLIIKQHNQKQSSKMLLLAFLGFLAVTGALPTQQILAPAVALTTIPAPNHILILTPQAQVQLEPSLKFPQQLVQNLAPVARIDSPTDQTVVYYPNENLINAFPTSAQKPKQLETANISNIVNQFVAAGQTAQAQLEAFQTQISQGLESLIQPGQKIESDAPLETMTLVSPAGQIPETARQDGGRFYSISNIPQYYNNFEVIQTPINPLYTVQPYQALRARSVAHPDDKILVNVPQTSAENINLAKIAVQDENIKAQPKPQENDNQARSADSIEEPAAQPVEHKSQQVQNEQEQLPVGTQFGKYLGSLDNSAVTQETQPESNKKDIEDMRLKEQDQKQNSELISFAEALPAGLAISGEGGLSQAKPVGSAIVGKDGVAYSAPSGTAIAGSISNENSSKSS